jgi:hypothetical protein
MYEVFRKASPETITKSKIASFLVDIFFNWKKIIAVK